NKNDKAIEIWTKSCAEYEELLKIYGFAFNEAYALTIYQEALAYADGDCGDLDVIYETIPPTIAKKIGDEQLYNDFSSLGNCNISAAFVLYNNTNEHLAVINLLNAFNPKFIFGKITQLRKV